MSDIDDLKELASIARDSGDTELELKALEKLDSIMSQGGVDQPGVLTEIADSLGSKRVDTVTETAQQARINSLPELGQGGLLGGEDGLKTSGAATAILTATNPNEIADILTNSFPNVGVSRQPPSEEFPDGRIVAVNNESGVAVELNKPGLSQLDVVQFLGIGSAFLPTGRMAAGGATLGQAALRGGAASGAIQTVVETGQALAGGAFDAAEVAIASGIGAASEFIMPAIKGTIPLIKSVFRNSDDPLAAAARATDDALASATPELADGVQQAIADAAAKKQTGKLAVIAQIDKTIMDDAAKLGVDLNPDHYASNRQFIEVMQGLKSKPGSILGDREARAIEALGNSADDLIREVGGDIDKAGLSVEFRQTMQAKVKELATEASDLYDKGGALIDPRVRLNRSNLSVVQFIDSEASKLAGGVDQLSPVMQKVNKLLSPVNGNLPTYGNLDAARKLVGQGMSREGPFADSASAELKSLYSKLAPDQQKVASLINPEGGAFIKAGSDLVVKRKAMEESLADVIGKKLQKDLVPETSAALKSLSRGNIEQFTRTINSIPKEFRQRAVATSLHDMFTAGGRSKGGNLGQGFVDFYKGLNRNPTAKDALFKELPAIAKERSDMIFNVSNGIYRAKAFENKSGTARAILASMDKDLGAIKKIYSATKLTMGQIPGIRLFEDILPDITPKTKKIDKFISSSQFSRAMQEAAKGSIERANQTIKSKAFREFIGVLDAGTKQDIAKQGFMNWLIEEEE